MSNYTLDNAWQQARHRLALLEQILDPTTQRRMRALGVGADWQCLDIGAGGGSIAQWLCAQVGPHGRVLATDIDVRFLDALAEPNLEVRRHDIVADDLPKATFDLVHTRMVLMHLPAREQVLKRLVAALRPGGWLLLEEADIFPIGATAPGAYARVWDATGRALAAAGARADWGRQLPTLLTTHGLSEVGAEADVRLFPGASPLAEFWRLTLTQLRERVIAVGASEQDLDAVLGMLTDTTHWFTDFAVVVAWGRRPVASQALGIPYEAITQVALIPAAYPKGTTFRAAARKPLDEVLHMDGW
jgi:SAM-dependent methyltransferase